MNQANETQEQFPAYDVMISRLFKKDIDNIAAGALMHAALALHGEGPELRDASDIQNTVEECGDIEFYIEAAKQHHEPDYQGAQAIVMNEGGRWKPHNARIAYDNVISLGGDLVDVVKKHWVYNKPLDRARVTFTLMMIEVQMLEVYKYLGITREQVIFVNQNKLIGPNGRFRSGFYSDQAAQDRADKQGETSINKGNGRAFFSNPSA